MTPHPVTTSVQVITPRRADELIRTMNVRNRTIRPWKVDEYAQAMSAGQWQLNGATIVISRTGKLNDGQHRLLGCVKANVPFETAVIEGVEDETFETVDGGLKRSAADTIGIDNVPNATAVAATARLLLGSEAGYATPEAYRATTAQVRDFVRRHPDVILSARAVGEARKVVGLPALLGMMHFMFAKKDREAADRFFHDLSLGSGLEAHDPVHVLREKLIRNRLSKNQKPTWGENAALIIRAWNARRKGVKLTLIRGLTKLPGQDEAAIPEIE